METRSYVLRGDPEEMFRALTTGLPSGAKVLGDSTQGGVEAFGTKLVDYSRTGNQLSVTVRRGLLIFSEADIWERLEAALRPYV